ncbi:MAG: penicillin-binding protein activator LpoB [Spirochaetaceae bacterium]|nr:MAG: penicillin-binding protein activator LpoB [Spirochaetaceae bacterium]
MKIFRIFLFIGLCFSFLACTSTPRTVTRVEVDTQTDLSGRWNDTDSRLVAEQMIKDVLGRPWLADFQRANSGSKPVIIVGAIRNKSSEHIEVAGFISDIERELINSGMVRFVANPQQREQIRREIEAQQSWSSGETMKRIAQETGADFMMQGTITTTVDAVDGKRAILYQVDLELINIETTEKVWIGTKKIKKIIEQARVGW